MRAVMMCGWLMISAASASAQAVPAGAPTEREIREACSFDAAGVRECLQKKLSDSEATLKSAETTMAAAIDQWDTEPKFSKLAKQKLSEASGGFAKYRAAQCAFAASLGGSAIGNALEMRRLACAAELNLRRAEALTASAAELPGR